MLSIEVVTNAIVPMRTDVSHSTLGFVPLSTMFYAGGKLLVCPVISAFASATCNDAWSLFRARMCRSGLCQDLDQVQPDSKPCAIPFVVAF